LDKNRIKILTLKMASAKIAETVTPPPTFSLGSSLQPKSYTEFQPRIIEFLFTKIGIIRPFREWKEKLVLTSESPVPPAVV
jgi:hypothetical protein